MEYPASSIDVFSWGLRLFATGAGHVVNLTRFPVKETWVEVIQPGK